MLRSSRAPEARWRASRTAPDAERPAQCGRDCHVLQMPGLRLQTPTTWDRPIMLASASDPQAQHWLGWHHRDVVPERHRERLLAFMPGQRRAPSPSNGTGNQWLIAVDPEDDWLAGALACDQDTGEIGGWLAPGFRGRGLGSSLFAGAAKFAHQHLGIASVTARTEPGNVACVAALTSAGFVPASGPSTHQLPSGRAVPVLWFRHEAARQNRCH